ncbi:Telomere-binding protein subunit beta [Gossypium australe]|uniref:Telomere-binding protein subunit beta n=1 Tax=Gossypium australe TaxID=47621 RepID=A0A5B6W4V7_9ROSI|nr:Telomere-binding protein subunit beta [Gossypium australe]
MLHSTTHTSLSLSIFSCFSSMSEILANSNEENSPQEQQQHSKANHMPRANLNVLPSQPRFPINSKDDSDIGLEKDQAAGISSRFSSGISQHDESELQLQVFLIGLENEKLKKKIRQLVL